MSEATGIRGVSPSFFLTGSAIIDKEGRKVECLLGRNRNGETVGCVGFTTGFSRSSLRWTSHMEMRWANGWLVLLLR